MRPSSEANIQLEVHLKEKKIRKLFSSTNVSNVIFIIRVNLQENSVHKCVLRLSSNYINFSLCT